LDIENDLRPCIFPHNKMQKPLIKKEISKGTEKAKLSCPDKERLCRKCKLKSIITLAGHSGISVSSGETIE